MKKIGTIFLSALLAIGFSYSANTSTVDAKSPIMAKKYQNCKELNKDYAGGVAKTASAKNKGGKTKYKPHISKELYDANQSKDRDGDLIACER
ncbi:excalibur calcium-binding domain-containing protein [Cytobacillus dafuensis]|uniref:Excalibur calcium-binding domain-containing protein n=1 Tax=Cytobacillus dafuensis TaxID=1742359 RepID=A0A5B8Z500_CYTDA|nr:excalibur calcium-binding domain-containing protein [Cytobacillus dafuensis]QED48180.1 excalibur calcium-binding domain-containing protein [Cytobacillus dafuensis]